MNDIDSALTAANLRPLSKYLNDPATFEVRVNKFGQVVSDTVNGRILHDDPAITEDYLHGLTNYLLHLNGLSFAPINYVKLPDGSRGTFCWPPAVVDGIALACIRKHLPVTKTLEELQTEGRFERAKHRTFADQLRLEPFEEEMLELLQAGDLVRFMRRAVQTKRNIAVSGPTGSGKTTFTRSLLLEVPRTERVILMEDVHEVTATNQDEIGYMLYGETDDGRVSARDCLKACMRLSPDRIFMTELRDDAAWDYLASANTGHPGGIFSTHAESAQTTPARIATLVKASKIGAMLDHEVIMKTIMTTLDVVVYMEKRDIVDVLYDPLAKKKALYA